MTCVGAVGRTNFLALRLAEVRERAQRDLLVVGAVLVDVVGDFAWVTADCLEVARVGTGAGQIVSKGCTSRVKSRSVVPDGG